MQVRSIFGTQPGGEPTVDDVTEQSFVVYGDCEGRRTRLAYDPHTCPAAPDDLPPPNNIYISTIEADSATLTWSAVPGASGIEVMLSAGACEHRSRALARPSPIRTHAIKLTSSRDPCTANTLTELSWEISGGREPYQLTIDGKRSMRIQKAQY